METTHDRSHFSAVAVTGLALLSLGAGYDNALAQAPSAAPPARVVTAKDLDLSRPGSISILYQRIWAAATSVCKPYNGDQAGSKVAWDSCRDATIAYTVARFNVPALEDYHLATTTRSQQPATLASQQRTRSKEEPSLTKE